MMESPCSSSGSSSTKLQNKFRKDNKRNVSYNDLHSEVKNDVIKPPSSGIHRKQHGRRKGLQKEELVKYMSKLPSFLEKGEVVKAKTLNLGVLDWHTLENWQNYHPQRPSSRYSTSSSITASSLWTDGSSNHNGRGDDTCYPSGHKGRRPSLHSYLNVSPIEGHSKHAESRAQNVANYTDIKAIPTNPFGPKQNIPRESVVATKYSELKMRKCKRENLDSQKTRLSKDFENHGLSASKGKLKVRGDTSKLESEKLQNQYNKSAHHVFSDGYDEVVSPLPRDSAESNHSRSLNLTGRSWKSKDSISSDGFHLQEVYNTDLYPRISQKTRSSKDFENYGLSSLKGKLKVQGDASKLESEKLQNQFNNSAHHVFSDGYDEVVPPMPRDGAESNHSHSLNLTGRRRKSKESISSNGFHLQEVYNTDLYPRISNSCAITRETDGSEEPYKEQKFSCSPACAIKSVSRATSKILEEKSSVMPTDSTSTKSLKVLNTKSTFSDSEARNPSPSSRLSSVLNRIRRKSYHFRNSSDVPLFISEDVTARPGSKIADSFICSNNATSNQSDAGSRDLQSPLKRLFNPLLKTKVANSRFADHSPKNSLSTRRFSASFNEQGELSSVDRLKVRLDFTKLRSPDLDETRQNKIQGSPTLQAYFQVSAKNDLPLFTFAVDSNGDALAASLRKFSSRKNDLTWIYTFFSIHETRRKSGSWLTQGSKVKDYVPNVVAQMKVSDLPISNLGEHLTVDQLSTREFVLYAMDLRLFDHRKCDMPPNDELAAIVVKFPRKIITGLEDSSQNVRVSSNLRDLQENKFSIERHELFSTTVILPGGIHGLPSTGEPSPLIERWLSGGQCDCGGWDLGCKVKILGNNNQKTDRQFKLFSQSEEKFQQATPFFMLSSIKNGIFSVEFDSTLSLLQAFSICVAVFDSMKASEIQQPGMFSEEKLAKEATPTDDCELRTPKLVEVDVPARFASQPHHNPVERV